MVEMTEGEHTLALAVWDAYRKGDLRYLRWLLCQGHFRVDDVFMDDETVFEILKNKDLADDLVRLLLVFGAPPDDFTEHLSPEQQELVRKAVVLRARLPRWREQRHQRITQSVGEVLPSAISDIVLEYYGPSPEDAWDEDTGVPLGDVFEEFVEVSASNLQLQDENARLRGDLERLLAERSQVLGMKRRRETQGLPDERQQQETSDGASSYFGRMRCA